MTLPPTVQTVVPGDIIDTIPKNPIKSSTYWGLVVLIVTYVVKRFLPQKFSNDVPVLLEIIAGLIGVGLVIYGRWNATRPLGLSATTRIQVKVILLAFVLTTVTTTQTGCAANDPLGPQKQTIIANDTYTTTLQVFTQAGRSGLLTPEVARTEIEPLRAAVATWLDKMQAAVDAGSSGGLFSDFAKALDGFNAAYAKYLQKRLELQRQKSVPPAATPPLFSTPSATPPPEPVVD